MWPLDVCQTDKTTITYNVLPTLSVLDHRFDRLQIIKLTRADTVRSVRLDGVEYVKECEPQIQEDRIIPGFPCLQGAADSRKFVEMAFDIH